jgi:hypothetical protein
MEESVEEVRTPDSARTIPVEVDAAPMPSSQSTQNRHSQKHRSIFEIWSDDIFDTEKDIFTNPGILESSATTMPFAPSSANATRSLKRKAHVLEETHGNIQKIPTQQSSQDMPQEFNDLEGDESVSTEVKGHTSSPVQDAPTGWEDIDRLMFEEYGRFINLT